MAGERQRPSSIGSPTVRTSGASGPKCSHGCHASIAARRRRGGGWRVQEHCRSSGREAGSHSEPTHEPS
eukprot:11315674-Alexandrium_andersonii.AAC.1